MPLPADTMHRMTPFSRLLTTTAAVLKFVFEEHSAMNAQVDAYKARI